MIITDENEIKQLIKLLHEMNQISKSIRKDNIYYLKNNICYANMQPTIGSIEPYSKHSVICDCDFNNELINNLIIDGKKFYAMYKNKKDISVIKIKKINNMINKLIIYDKKGNKMFSSSKRKSILKELTIFSNYKFEKISDKKEITDFISNKILSANIPINIKENINDENINFRITKKLLYGFKKDSKAFIEFYKCKNNADLYGVTLIVNNGIFTINNFYIIINYEI